jgi:subtilase family serine protease
MAWICAALPVAGAQSKAPSAPPREATGRVSLSEHVPDWATADNDLGPADGSLELEYLKINLKRSPEREQAFQRLLIEQQDSRSTRFHQWLTPEQIGAQYGPTATEIDAVRGWLESKGLRVDRVANSRMFVVFRGRVAEVNAAFGVEMHEYRGVHGALLSTAQAPKIPAALAAVVGSITGLSEHHTQPAAHGRAGVRPELTYCYQSGCDAYVTPADFATIYDINSVYSAGTKGAGQTIAIVGRAQVWSSDIEEYESRTGLPELAPTLIIPPDGISPPSPNTSTADPPNDDQLEATLDTQRTFGTAPGAVTDLVVSLSTQTEDGIDIAKDYVIDGHSTLGANILTNSFGECEADVTASFVEADDALFQQAAAEGISVIGISGDSGAAGCDSYNYTPPATQVKSPNYLCSSGYVTCMGGTEFNDAGNFGKYWTTMNGATLGSALSYIPEGAWNEPGNSSSGFVASATGGGVSSDIATPYWQTGTGVPGTQGRYTPDISFTSAAHDGYYGCYAAGGGACTLGYFEYFYGTSAAAPSMAGVVALLNEEKGGAQGALNPKLYLLANLDPAAFHDTTVGSSGVSGCVLTIPSICNNSTPSPATLSGGLQGYEVNAGFDLATGWGSIDVAQLLSNWSSYQTSLTTVALSVSPGTTIAAGQKATLTAKVSASSGSPSGSVTFSVGTFVLGKANVSGGKAVLAASSAGVQPGTYPVVASYAGTAVFTPAQSKALNVTVTSSAPTVTTLSASPTTVTAGGKVTLTAQATSSAGTPSGSVTFYYGSLALGSASLASGTAALSASSAGAPAGTYGITATYGGGSGFGASTSGAVNVKVLQ